MARLWFSVDWLNISPDVAVKGFLKMWLRFKSVDWIIINIHISRLWVKQILPIMWMGFMQSVKGLKSKERLRLTPKERVFLQDSHIKSLLEFLACSSLVCGLRLPHQPLPELQTVSLPYRVQICQSPKSHEKIS